MFRLLAGVALLAAFGWAAAILAVAMFGRHDEARPADAIVVLGAAQYDGRPSPVLRARLDHAISLYEDGIAPLLILTGGVGVGDTVSEAEVGRRYARRAGVPEAHMLTEPAGLSTGESMRAVKRIMEERSLDSAVLVSDPFHMLRLRLLAWGLGMRAYSSPTRTSPIAADSRAEWRYVFRETLLLPSALIRGL